MNKKNTSSRVDRDAVLKARAILLAREIDDKRTEAEFTDVVEFMITDESYGIELKFTREIYPLKEITPLPASPAFISGIVNVRGEIVSVVDIKKFFDLPDTETHAKPHLIILENENMTFGLLADRIVGMGRIDKTRLQGALPTMTGIREDYLIGVAKGRMALLDGGRLLTDKKMHIDMAS
ncbi:MAG: chemotaxis protein CheW [Deltaproteobacteria bacterium]|nr:chemotaxis protein CheW [Deltaproteobacteria bacterium]